jgi:hypothetical protein
VAWIAALVVPVALLGLLLLMERLEDTLARRVVGDDIAAAIATAASPEELERLVAVAAERLFAPQPWRLRGRSH